MLPYRDSRITKIALIVFFLLIVGYAYYEARGVLYGPRITVPLGVIESSDQFVAIQGKAERIAELSMNGRPISVTEDGVFNEPYLLAPGLNRIMLDATDRYGRSSQEMVQIIYTPTSTSSVQAGPNDPNPTATSTQKATSTP
jgi:hypothetical protein